MTMSRRFFTTTLLTAVQNVWQVDNSVNTHEAVYAAATQNKGTQKQATAGPQFESEW